MTIKAPLTVYRRIHDPIFITADERPVSENLLSFCLSSLHSINMSLPGLPPLPKSLSGIELTQQQIQIQQQQMNQANNYHSALQVQQQQQNQLNSFDSQRSLTSSSSSSISRKTNSTLDNQLAILRREMVRIIS